MSVPWPLAEFFMISDVDYIASIVMKDSFASLAVVQDVLKSESFMISTQHTRIHSIFLIISLVGSTVASVEHSPAE